MDPLSSSGAADGSSMPGRLSRRPIIPSESLNPLPDFRSWNLHPVKRLRQSRFAKHAKEIRAPLAEVEILLTLPVATLASLGQWDAEEVFELGPQCAHAAQRWREETSACHKPNGGRQRTDSTSGSSP
ncbi:hypothetical protein AcV7_006808 [Taiwanofungus camphoratus]|nr:hypothetical protein AcV7_006808 [Antrodia cinnamomea]